MELCTDRRSCGWCVEAETDQLKAEIEARQVADVSAIEMAISLIEQKGQQEIDRIEGMHTGVEFVRCVVYSKPGHGGFPFLYTIAMHRVDAGICRLPMIPTPSESVG